MRWPTSSGELVAVQNSLAALSPEPWYPATMSVGVGGVFVCFGRGGAGRGIAGDVGWAGAAVGKDGLIVAQAGATGPAGGPFLRGCLAIREGPLLEAALGALADPPDVVLVNATGRDHPRRAGLALHLGAVLNIPTVGVTHRPLEAVGDWPPIGTQGSFAPILIGKEIVGYWVRTQQHRRPLAVHAGWRTSPETARDLVVGTMSKYRTPEPLREARRLARTARTRETDRPRTRPMGQSAWD